MIMLKRHRRSEGQGLQKPASLQLGQGSRIWPNGTSLTSDPQGGCVPRQKAACKRGAADSNLHCQHDTAASNIHCLDGSAASMNPLSQRILRRTQHNMRSFIGIPSQWQRSPENRGPRRFLFHCVWNHAYWDGSRFPLRASCRGGSCRHAPDPQQKETGPSQQNFVPKAQNKFWCQRCIGRLSLEETKSWIQFGNTSRTNRLSMGAAS